MSKNILSSRCVPKSPLDLRVYLVSLSVLVVLLWGHTRGTSDMSATWSAEYEIFLTEEAFSFGLVLVLIEF